jgi:hypothetical protein
MSKVLHIVVVMLGFFMTPSVAFMWNKADKISCCKKESSSKENERLLRRKKSNESSHDGCNGACKNVSCSSSMSFGFNFGVYTELNKTSFSFHRRNKVYGNVYFFPFPFYLASMK